MRALRYLWAFPATLVGVLIAAVAFAGGASARACNGTLEVAGGRLGRWIGSLPPRWRFGAITFGHVIFAVEAGVLERCRSHERVHVRQYERWGILFFPLYLGSSLHALATGRDPYRDNRFEREAFATNDAKADRSVEHSRYNRAP